MPHYLHHGWCTCWEHGVRTGPEPVTINVRTGQSYCQRCAKANNWPPGPHPSY